MTDNLASRDFATLFLANTPLIDTRAPTEFAKGSVPGAVNLPLMTDTEREQVGRCYKEDGQDAAVALGHELVSGAVKSQRVARWQAFVQEHPQAALFCFRGGMRSAISQQWLAECGIGIPRIEGGYKALRQFLLDVLAIHSQQRPLTILAGETGAAKTRLLQDIEGDHPEHTLDLEGLAHHRGSAFGKRPTGQPSQIDFENALAVAFLKTDPHAQRLLLLEDESRLIGRCAIPGEVHRAMQCAPLIVLQSTLEERVHHSYHNYILDNLQAHEAMMGDPERAFEEFAQGLLRALDSIQKRLGGARHGTLRATLQEALQRHRQGDPLGHLAWISTLLQNYYDPMYRYQLAKREDLIIFKGDAASVRDFLAQRFAH